MQPGDQIKRYIETLCQQIRWEKMHESIAREIKDHLDDQIEVYIYQGYDRELATEQAIAQMGDPITIGLELDRIHRPNPQWEMLILAGSLMLLGVIANQLIGRLAGYSTQPLSLSSYIVSLTIFVSCYFLDFAFLGKHPIKLFLSVLIIAIIGLLSSNGNLTWVFGGRLILRLPYLALLFPLTFALLIYALRQKEYIGILGCSLGYITLSTILLLVPTLTGFVLFSVVAFTLLILSVWKGWFGLSKKIGLILISILLFCVITGLGFYVSNNAYLSNRIALIIKPNLDPSGSGFMGTLIRQLITKSNLFGQGKPINLFNKDNLVIPNSNTDYILATLTYHYGWIAFILVVATIVGFSLFGFQRGIRQKNILGSLVSLSIMLTISLQAAFYIITNLGFASLSSVSLPLVSYGNTALIINSALIGIMLSVFRVGVTFKDKSPYRSLNKPKSV